MTSQASARQWLSAYERLQSYPGDRAGRSDGLGYAASAAVACMPNACSATIARFDGTSWVPLSSFGPRAVAVEKLRGSFDGDQGSPDMYAADVIHSGDLAQDARWTASARAAAKAAGVRSLLSIPVVSSASRRPLTMDLCSPTPYAFTDGDIVTATLIATDVAGALMSLLHRGLDERDRSAILTAWELGVAAGRVAERSAVTVDEAFTLVRLASQYSTCELGQVARGIAESGDLQLPSQPSSPRRPRPAGGPRPPVG